MPGQRPIGTDGVVTLQRCCLGSLRRAFEMAALTKEHRLLILNAISSLKTDRMINNSRISGSLGGGLGEKTKQFQTQDPWQCGV